MRGVTTWAVAFVALFAGTFAASAGGDDTIAKSPNVSGNWNMTDIDGAQAAEQLSSAPLDNSSSAAATRRSLQGCGYGKYAPAFCPSGRSMTGCCYKNGRVDNIYSGTSFGSARSRSVSARTTSKRYGSKVVKFVCRLDRAYCKFADSE